MATVNIYLRDGTMQSITIPRKCGITVRVVDYDCEGQDCSDTDDKGASCNIELYQANPNQGE